LPLWRLYRKLTGPVGDNLRRADPDGLGTTGDLRTRDQDRQRGVVTPRWELAYLCTYWLPCDLGVLKKRHRRGPEQSEGTAANQSSSAARGERARTPRGGDTPALDPGVRGTRGRRVCRTAYLEHLRPVWFRHGCVWNRPREAGARKLRPVRAKVRSGRRGEALTGLWTTESNTPAFKRC
jgi:hypothetical protein